MDLPHAKRKTKYALSLTPNSCRLSPGAEPMSSSPRHVLGFCICAFVYYVNYIKEKNFQVSLLMFETPYYHRVENLGWSSCRFQ